MMGATVTENPAWTAPRFFGDDCENADRRGRQVSPASAVSLLSILFVTSFGPAAAVGTDSSLVDRVAGNCYERRVLDSGGRVTGYQRIRVRDPTHGPRGLEARIDVVQFKTSGPRGGELHVDDRFEFKMVGEIADDAQEEAALQVVGYIGSNSRVSLDFLDQTVIYPAVRCDGESLPPVRLDVSAKGGLVDLLGGRAEIRITDRTCRSADDEGTYSIEADLSLKMYLLGVRFKRERYHSRQLVDVDRGLVRHVLEKPDGGRQELTMVEYTACL